MASYSYMFVIFFSLTAVTLSQISCWYGSTIQYGNGPVQGQISEVPCPYSYYCMKTYYHDKSAKYYSNNYGCADYRCARNGCTENRNGYGECCCSKNMCNSGISPTSAGSMILALGSFLYMYL
uniref:Uncharacterized protein n=1 Tax=Caenorhabditis japonica TaxID=281687 RepID=A0A8R1HKM4_CAEJA